MSFSKENEIDSFPIDRVTGRVRGSVNMIDIQRNVEWVEVSGRWSRMSVRKTYRSHFGSSTASRAVSGAVSSSAVVEVVVSRIVVVS